MQSKDIRTIILGTYTQNELNEFLQLCYSLALPYIRKKISWGKLNLDYIGLNQNDLIHDCIADLFQRDDTGNFFQIQTFFERHCSSIQSISNDESLALLTQLVLGKVNKNLIRIYSEADPALGKIIRNLKLSLQRHAIFEQIIRFGDTYLIPAETDPLWHLPFLPMDRVKSDFLNVTNATDKIPAMMQNLHAILLRQHEYQRAVPLVSTALLFKEVSALGWDSDTNEYNEEIFNDITRLTESVTKSLFSEMLPSYVAKGKCSQETLTYYTQSVKAMLVDVFVRGDGKNFTYFEYLQMHLPALTKEEYLEHHRDTLEYFAKIAKQKMRDELKSF